MEREAIFPSVRCTITMAREQMFMEENDHAQQCQHFFYLSFITSNMDLSRGKEIFIERKIFVLFFITSFEMLFLIGLSYLKKWLSKENEKLLIICLWKMELSLWTEKAKKPETNIYKKNKIQIQRSTKINHKASRCQRKEKD